MIKKERNHLAFSTQIFVFCFFPAVLAGYGLAELLERKTAWSTFLRKYRVRDLILVGFSLVFFGWACFDGVFQLAEYVLAIYLAGRAIGWLQREKPFLRLYREQNPDAEPMRLRLSPVFFTAAVVLTVGLLVYFKYYNFLGELFHSVLRTSFEEKEILAPLGISFLTFSAISYLTDLYRGQAGGRNLLDCALYLTFFPKVVSGPIVLWKEFEPQIRGRATHLDQVTEGINRMILGFAKKVILADQFGACLATISYQEIDAVTAAMTVLLYSLQLYYDFAGYSDIAIGLSKFFGFEVQDNFRFPYRSKSIGEFWRRWHISLGAWFREYLYFPLGGSRGTLRRTLVNLSVVFLVTGIWHGAAWHYVLWGCLNGLAVVIERVIQDRPFYRRTPGWVRYAVTMVLVAYFWQLFRFETMAEVNECLGIALGLIRFDRIGYSWRYYFDLRLLVLTAVGVVGATVLGSPKLKQQWQRFSTHAAGYALQELGLLVLFGISLLFLVNSTYSPFLYFQY